VTSSTVRVGTSGWQYDAWRGDFYPREVPATRLLEYASERFDTVELNGSFYSLQRPSSYQSWHDQTPDGFVFAVKGGRFITHLKRLAEVETALANFFASGILLLGPKLGPVLWQLPERLQYDRRLIGDFLDLLPRTIGELAKQARGHDSKVRGRAHVDAHARGRVRHALEVRHSSFVDDTFFELLADHDMACVVADSPRRWPEIDVATADFSYVRLHGHTELYASGYSSRSLDRWAERCQAWAEAGDVYCYFDNDARGRAPYDALGLAERLGERRVRRG
jgi:uncharacterized protein YecE (DUF72 family)